MEKLYQKISSKNTALIVIDIINSCASEQCEIKKWKITFSRIRKMVPELELFVDSYRKNINKNVIFINTTPWQADFLADNIKELYWHNPDSSYYSSDKTGFAEKFFKLKLQKTDTIFTKNTYDAFADGRLDKLLKNKQIKYLVVTGIFGEGCVMATINGAFSKGYSLVILEDLIETADDPVRLEILAALKKRTWPLMYGHTLDSKKFSKLWKNQKVR